jgi:hypothetical protein
MLQLLRRRRATALEEPAVPEVPGGGRGHAPKTHPRRVTDPNVVRLHVSPESRRVGAVGSVRPVDAPTPGPKPAPFVDRPTLDLVALKRGADRAARWGRSVGGEPWVVWCRGSRLVRPLELKGRRLARCSSPRPFVLLGGVGRKRLDAASADTVPEATRPSPERNAGMTSSKPSWNLDRFFLETIGSHRHRLAAVRRSRPPAPVATGDARAVAKAVPFPES